MKPKELRRLLAFSYAAKHAFSPSITIISKRASKNKRFAVKQGRKTNRNSLVATHYVDNYMQTVS